MYFSFYNKVVAVVPKDCGRGIFFEVHVRVYVCTCSEPMFLILLFDIFVIYLELCWARYVLLYVLLNVLYLQSVSN